MDTKTCTTCSQDKPLTEFYKHHKHKDGHNNECQSCCRDRYSPKRRAVMHQIRRQRILNDPVRRKDFALKSLLRGARARAKSKNFEFNLTYEWAIQKIGEVCPVFGTPFQFMNSTHAPESASIDRIDNSQGYTQKNCIFVSYKANTIKSSASVNELKKLTAFYDSLTS